MSRFKECKGEVLGTYILVLFGCGAVGGAVIFGAFNSLFEVAFIWGLGVSLGILASRNLSSSHLNPAVSLAMVLSGKFALKKLPGYILSQIIGAFLAASTLYLIFYTALELFETNNMIIRGDEKSIISAQMFGEFFPNPGFATKIEIHWIGAMLAEAIGTFLLVFMIFKITEQEKEIDNTTPLFIGLTVTVIICLIAPFTQAGLNPARDFAPRLFSYFAGWGSVVFQSPGHSFFTVYILGPFLGAAIAAMTQKRSKSSSKSTSF